MCVHMPSMKTVLFMETRSLLMLIISPCQHLPITDTYIELLQTLETLWIGLWLMFIVTTILFMELLVGECLRGKNLSKCMQTEIKSVDSPQQPPLQPTLCHTATGAVLLAVVILIIMCHLLTGMLVLSLVTTI